MNVTIFWPLKHVSFWCKPDTSNKIYVFMLCVHFAAYTVRFVYASGYHTTCTTEIINIHVWKRYVYNYNKLIINNINFFNSHIHINNYTHTHTHICIDAQSSENFKIWSNISETFEQILMKIGLNIVWYNTTTTKQNKKFNNYNVHAYRT